MADAVWENYRFILLDTGGLESDPEGAIRQKVQEQAEMAMAPDQQAGGGGGQQSGQ